MLTMAELDFHVFSVAEDVGMSFPMILHAISSGRLFARLPNATRHGFKRTGFKEPSSMNLILICLMFKTYHALRKDFSQMIDASVTDCDFSDIQSRSLFLARLFASDYGL